MPSGDIPSPRVNSERQGALLAAAACLVCCIAGLPIALGEWRSEAIITAMDSGDGSARGDILERFADTPPGALPDRAKAALAQIALTTSAEAPEPGLRQMYLARARELIDHLHATRAGWVPSLILSTELAIAASGAATSPQAMADYAASYRAAPFLRQEARWRIALGARAWRQLDRATRQHMIDEAVWLTRYDNAQRGGIETNMGDSPAGAAYQLALLRVATPPHANPPGED